MKDDNSLNHLNESNGSGNPIPHPAAIPAELAGTARLLDALGEFDRVSGPAGMESRVLRLVQQEAGEAALRSDDVDETGSQLGALAQADQTSASATLEDRIFMATRRILVHHASLAEEEHLARPTFHFGRTLVRIAAGLLLGGSVIWGYQAIKPATPFKVNAPTEVVELSLEKKLDQQLDDLGNVFALAMVGSESETPTETDPLDEWFQFDFVEGSGSL